MIEFIPLAIAGFFAGALTVTKGDFGLTIKVLVGKW